MTCSANSAERLAWQLGQKLRVRQENASQRPLPRLVAFLVLPDVALEVLLEQPVDDGALGVAGPVDARGLGEGHASATGGGKVGRERATSR